MDNPFKTAREELRLSHSQVAEKTGLTKVYVIRQEQGVYPNPSDKLIEFYSQQNYFTRELFRQKYRQYQSWCRLKNGPTENPVLYPINPNALTWLSHVENPTIHPMRLWMNFNGKELSGMAVCKAYCVSPAILNRFLTESYRVKTMPDTLEEVLIEAGYSTQLVHKMDELYRNWRKRVYNSG